MFPALQAYTSAHRIGWTKLSPADIVFSPRRLVQPDIFVVPWREPRPAAWTDVKSLLLAVEVLSPSTSQVDRWRKVADYRTLPSVREILIVFHDERRVELQRRAAEGWRVEDLIGKAVIRLSCCEDPVPLEAVYGDLLSEPAAPEAPLGA